MGPPESTLPGGRCRSARATIFVAMLTGWDDGTGAGMPRHEEIRRDCGQGDSAIVVGE